MNVLRVALAAFLLSFALVRPAAAMLPDSGWYWNPAQSGRGFNIEIQDNLLFMAAFAYDAEGQPTWYVAGGPMSSDRSFSGRASRVTGGPCFGCPYTAPGVTDAGSVSVVFGDEGSAMVTILGESIAVRRQDFANLTLNPDALYGEWSTTEGDPAFPIYFGERISLGAPFTSNAGETYASGRLSGGSSSRVALGRYDPSLGAWLLLLDSSTNYYHLYRFRFTGLNRIEGTDWLYEKTGNPTGSGTFFLAHRTKSKARVNGLNAPGTTKAAGADEGVRDAIDRMRGVRPKGAAVDELAPSLEVLRDMEAQLSALPR